MTEQTDITTQIQQLYEEQQALKNTRVLDPDMFAENTSVSEDELTLHELIDRMLFGTIDLPLRDDMLNKVFHRFYDALPTNEHLAVFRRKFDGEVDARWPVRISSFEDLRALITLGGQDALYKYGDALFYLQQMRREDLEEKQKALKEQQEAQEQAVEQKALSDEAFEAWLAVMFIQHPYLLNQYQAHYAAQSEGEPETDPVSDTLATPPIEESVMEDDTYIPDKGTQNDMMEFVHKRLNAGEDSSGYAYDYEQDTPDMPDPANSFEEAATADEAAAPDLNYG